MFTALDEYGIENAEGRFESVVIGEFPSKRAALKAARQYVTIHGESTILITAGRSQSFDDEVGSVFLDDHGSIVTECYA